MDLMKTIKRISPAIAATIGIFIYPSIIIFPEKSHALGCLSGIMWGYIIGWHISDIVVWFYENK